MWLPVEPNISIRKNQKECCWEVIVNLGKFGRLFHYKKDAQEFAEMLQKPGALETNLYDTLKKVED